MVTQLLLALSITILLVVSWRWYLAHRAIRTLEREREFERSASAGSLGQQKTQLDLVTDAAELGLWTWYPATETFVWSDKARYLLGISPDAELNYEEAFRTMHPDDRPNVEEAIRLAIETRRKYYSEYRVMWPDKSIHWIGSVGKAYFRPDGAVERLEGVVRDITERKRADVAIEESEKRFRALITATSYSIFRMSPDWSEMRELQGRGFLSDTDGAISNWWEKYILPEDKATINAVIDEAIRTKSLFDLEHKVLRADGSVGWVHSRAVPMLGANGKITEWFGAASDISDRKGDELELFKQAQEFDILCKSVPDAVWIALPNGENTLVNRYWLSYTGTTAAANEKLGWRNQIHPDDVSLVWDTWQDAVATRNEFSVEARVRRVDGEYRWWQLRGAPAFDENGQPYEWVGTGTDIHDRKLQEEELRTKTRKAEEEVKILRGLIRICATCGRTVDDDLRWIPVEQYVLKHSKDRFTYGLCPDCQLK